MTGPTLPFGALDLSDTEIAARFAAARRSGEPMWLWPSVDREAWRAGLAAIERVLRAELAGDTALSLGNDARSRDAAGIALAAFTSGTGPLLGRWVEHGKLDASAELAPILALHLAHGRERWMRLQARAAELFVPLRGLGLQPILLKGVHTAVAFFEEPGCRPCSDLDLSIPRASWPAVVAALESAGYRTLVRQDRIAKAELLPPGEGTSQRSLDLLHRDAPIRVDVHGGLDREFFGVGSLVIGEVADNETAPWPSVDPSARVLKEPLLTTLLAGHASDPHNQTLIRLFELVRVLRAEATDGRLDWDAILERVGGGGRRFLFPSLEMADRLAPGVVTREVRTALRQAATPAMRRVIDRLTPATVQRLGSLSLEERLMWAGSPIEMIRRLADIAWPGSAGGSWRRLARIYGDRFWRIVRGRGPLS
jgi:hypothetical protein